LFNNFTASIDLKLELFYGSGPTLLSLNGPMPG
jgi:hypothetical protein